MFRDHRHPRHRRPSSPSRVRIPVHLSLSLSRSRGERVIRPPNLLRRVRRGCVSRSLRRRRGRGVELLVMRVVVHCVYLARWIPPHSLLTSSSAAETRSGGRRYGGIGRWGWCGGSWADGDGGVVRLCLCLRRGRVVWRWGVGMRVRGRREERVGCVRGREGEPPPCASSSCAVRVRLRRNRIEVPALHCPTRNLRCRCERHKVVWRGGRALDA